MTFQIDLEERRANERLLLVDRRGAEHVTRPQVERDVLNHVGQKLEVLDVADEIQAIHLRKADKDVLWDGDTDLVLSNFSL